MISDRVRRFALACLVAGVVIVVDQASKAVALALLTEEHRIPLLADLLGLQLAFNPGAILSIGSGSTWLLTLLGVAATVALLVAAARVRSTATALAIGIILGGAVGNLIDRFFSPPGWGRGYVTDFLAYGDLFIGNLADIALGVGVMLLLLSVRKRPAAAPALDSAPLGGAT